ncbi:MAG: DHH family phosphoesterase [Bacilli bacterium]|nr:DHH family phosphoesterase [Bacilli bacterium]
MKYKIIGRNNYNADNLLYEILYNREVEDIEKFLNIDESIVTNPLSFKNMDIAVKCLLKHLEEESNILIIPDTDVDGLTASTLLYNYIKEIYPNANLFFQNHIKKTHGIMLDDLKDILPTIQLLILPDASSEQFKEHKIIKDMGIDIIVLDHHSVKGYSKNAIVVNNQLSKISTNLSGVGMTYKFCKALDEELWEDKADKYLDLVAVGLLADYMDTKDLEVQYYIRKGLSNIKSPALKALIEAQDFSLKGEINPIAIAFYIAPLINSVYRLGKIEDKDLMFKSFSNIDSDKTYIYKPTRGSRKGQEIEETIYQKSARMCVSHNNKRKRLSEKLIKPIEDQINLDNKIICVKVDKEESEGMSGLLANALLGKFNKPSIVYSINSKNEIKGSMRANTGDFKDKLQKTGLFVFVAGHQDAAGLQIKEHCLEDIDEKLNEFFKDETFEKIHYIDFKIPFEEISFEFIKDICDLKYMYSTNIKEPLIYVENVKVQTKDIKLIGKKKNTIKIETDEVDFIKFRSSEEVYNDMVDWKDEVVLNIVGRASINEYNGKLTGQIFVDEWEVLENDN